MTQASPVPPAKSSPWMTILKVVVTVLIIAYFSTKVDWHQLWSRIVHADPTWLMTAIILGGITQFLVGLRFWLLLRVQEIFISPQYACCLYFIGLFFNNLLPGAIGGDIVKLYYILQKAPTRKARATMAVIMDRALGLTVLLTIMAIALPSQIGRFADAKPRIHFFGWETSALTASAWGLVALLVTGILVGLIILVFPFRHTPSFIKALWQKVPGRDFFEMLHAGFKDHLKHPLTSFCAVGVAAICHMGNFVVGYALIHSLGIPLNFTSTIVIMALVMSMMAVPISFGGHGLREAGFAILFTLYLVPDPENAGVACGLFLLAVTMIWALLGGFFYLTLKHNEKAVTPDLP